MAGFTRQAIQSSFCRLLAEKPLNKISVRDIVEDCGINRNSFYYHYQDIPALLDEIVAEQTEKLMQAYPTVASLDECFQAAFRFARRNRSAVRHIYESANRDLFIQGALRLSEYFVTRYVSELPAAQHADPHDRQILITCLKCQLFGMCIDWIVSGMKDEAYDDLRRGLALWRGIPEQLLQKSAAQGQSAVQNGKNV